MGGTLAEHLVTEANDITLVDLDSDRLRELQNRLDIRTVLGMGSHPDESKLVVLKLIHDSFTIATYRDLWLCSDPEDSRKRGAYSNYDDEAEIENRFIIHWMYIPE